MTPEKDDAIAWHPEPGRDTSLLFDVFVLGQRARALVGAAMHGAGLRPDEYAVYSVVFETSAITLSELARRLGMPVTTVADYVRAMLERGHVRRDRHPRDGRALLLTLTARGLRVHRRASGAFERAHRALREALAADETHARQVLRQLAAGVERASVSLKSGSSSLAG